MRRFTAHLALVWLVLTSCTPAKAPTATDIATAAVVLTDSALAAVIEATPLDAGVDLDARYEHAVQTLETAKAVLETRSDVCKVLPSVTEVATQIQCEKCTALITKASEALSCQH